MTNPKSELGINGWEAEILGSAIEHLGGDTFTTENSQFGPRLGGASLALRLAPVYLDNAGITERFGGKAVTDGSVIFVSRSLIPTEQEPTTLAQVEALDLDRFEKAISDAASLVAGHWSGAELNSSGEAVKVTPQALDEAFSSVTFGGESVVAIFEQQRAFMAKNGPSLKGKIEALENAGERRPRRAP